jgi:hypothetical protein
VPTKVSAYSQLCYRGNRHSTIVLRYIRPISVLPRQGSSCGMFTRSHYHAFLTLYFYTQVAPKFVNSLVELITSSIDNIQSPDVHPSQRAPPGLIEGVQTPEMIIRHFRNSLYYIQRRKDAAAEGSGSASDSRWDEVEVVGALLKMGIRR